jgi:predicted alpha-1,2-mannosidase
MIARAIAAAFFMALAPVLAYASDPADLVNPFIGSTYSGDTFPGPDYPFGMIQWSPDTASQPAGGGYEYTDQTLTGFSLTHLSGVGCPVTNDFAILPAIGTVADPMHPSMPFTHVQEHASPGWYEVLLGDNMDLDVSLTSTLRTGLAAFRFPGTAPAHVLFNLAHSGANVLDAQITSTGNTGFEGYVTSGGFCNMPGHYTVYVAGEFDRPFQAFRRTDAWHAVADFGGAHQTVKLRMAISFVDLDGARKNLRTEGTSWNLDAVHQRALAAWRAYLNHASIAGGTDAQQHSFWTALYHSLLHPNVISDVDGRWPGFDGKIHRVASGHREYGNWSGWDVYRTQLQLLGFLFPHEASDMVRSLLDASDRMGALPRWALVDDETSVMNGDPGPALIADAYFFGANDFDARKALQAMLRGADANRAAVGQGWYQERNDLAEYERLGYVDSHRQNSVSHVPNGASETLEYAISDYAIAAFARNLHDMQAYRQFLRRSGNWANLFQSATGLIEPRDEHGNFVVVPSTGEGQLGFQEGNAEQYTWEVPQDPSGMVRLQGGDAAAIAHLDRFFSVLPEHDGDWGTPYIGLNNEPSFGAPFMYLSAHAPSRTQQIVRLIETKYFDNAPGGEPGNDDLGAMSAMYLWESLGLYPQTPGTATLDIASPLFTHAELRSEDGRRIVIEAPKARTDAPYVRQLLVDGHVSARTWVTVPAHGTLRLAFDLTNAPTSWGSARGDEPPSFASGVRPPPASTPVLASQSLAEDPLPTGQLGTAPYVVSYFDGTISLIGSGAESVEKAFTLGERVPDALAIPGMDTVALASIYTDSVAFVDLKTRAVQTRVKTGSNPAALALSSDRSTLWVAERGANTVRPIVLGTMKAGSPITVGSHPVALLISSDGKTLFALNQGSNDVSVVDLERQKEIARIPVGAAPSAMAFGPNGVLYVANTFSDDVSVVDLKTRTVLSRIPVGVFPRALALAGDRTFVANWANNTISVIDSRTAKVVKTLPAGQQPAALAVSADGSILYIAISGENAFQTFDIRSGRLSGEVFTSGSSPRTVRVPANR